MINAILFTLFSTLPIMPVTEIEHGQKGECITVFEGETIEAFPFIVKGVMPDFLGPHRDLILIRLMGEKAEFTGVVAGMSGSPCSINGKMIGALSYSFATFAKEPIAGVTPYQSMLDVMRLPKENLPVKRAQHDWEIFSQGLAQQIIDTNGLKPIATPLSMSGVPPFVQNYFSPYFSSLGFEMQAGGGAAKSTKNKTSLRPGDAVAAVMVQGDIHIAATGTVTSIEGKEVLAFGHPFMGAGAVSLPMAKASIINTMASSMRSFKMGITGAVVGELTQDRVTAIGGYLGDGPPMIPMNGVFKNKQQTFPFHLEIARDAVLSPRFIAVGLASALNGRVEASDRGTLRLKGKIRVNDISTIEVENVFSAERDNNLFIYAALDIAKNVAAVWDTPFTTPPKIAVDVEALYDETPVREIIENLTFTNSIVKAGESLQIAVRLRLYGGGFRTEYFSVPIPLSLAGETIEVVVSGSKSRERLEREVAGMPEPNDLKDILTFLNQQFSDGQLYLDIIRSKRGLRSGVEMLSSLPPSVIFHLADEKNIEERRLSFVFSDKRASLGTLDGVARKTLQILSP